MQPQLPPPPPPPQPLLPPGWERALDSSSGRYYYANRSTGETSWDPPLPPPPPPPPPRFSVPPPPPMHQHQVIAQSPHQSLPHTYNQQHHSIQHPPTFNPAFPPPNIPVGHNTIPVGAPQFPPPQPMIPQPEQIMPSTLPTTGKVGYQFDASTATSPGLLVPSVRAMITKEMSKNPAPKLELEGLTAGAIADLCNITNEFRAKTTNIDKGDFADDVQPPAAMEDVNQYYMPLEPFTLPAPSRPPHIEAGRVDIRLHALYSKLNRI